MDDSIIIQTYSGRLFVRMVSVLAILLFSACGSSVKENIEMMIGTEITLDTADMRRLEPENGTLQSAEPTKFTLVHYIDSTECLSCMTQKLHDWDNFISAIQSKNRDVMFLCVMAPRAVEVDNLEVSLRLEKLNFPVYIDMRQIFATNNKFIPGSPIYHTFLINEQRQVILVGDPRKKPKIEKLFWKYVLPDTHK